MTRIPRLIIDGMIAVLGALGALFCLSTAFSLTLNPMIPILVTVISAYLFTACFLWKRALWLLLPFGLLMGLLLALHFDRLGATALTLVHNILSRFSSAYPNFSFAIPPVEEGLYNDVTALYALLGVILAGWMAWAVGYRSCLITVAGTLPFLLLCVIINDTPPHVLPLILLLTAWVTVLMAQIRPTEAPLLTAARTLLTLLAVLLLLTVIGTAYPKEDTRLQELPPLVQSILDRLPGPMQNMLSRDSQGFRSEELGADTDEVLDLTTQGTRERKDTVMLQVSSTESGVLYLRGAAKDIYTGSRWESRGDSTTAEAVYSHTSLGAAFGGDYQAAVQVANILEDADVAFTPYGFISCAGAEDIVNDLRVPCYQDDYICYYWPGVGELDLSDSQNYFNPNPGYDRYVADTCLDLPRSTRQALYDLALSYGYDPDLSTLDTVAWVAEFVRTVGTYQLHVSRQPTNYDFAVYFLTESQKGYCVHFATAAATMLRALGVPSRYASGYRVTIPEAGAVTDVTDMDTHAWAEAYMEGLGWIPIETTPGFGSSANLPEVAHEPEPSQAPEPAAPSEEPAAPSEEPAAPSEVPPSPSAVEPSAVPGVPQETSGNGHPLRMLLWIPVLLLLAAAFLFVRRLLILRRRSARFHGDNPNQALIEQWLYLEQLARWDVEIPDGMENLALKAKFSQHEITKEELTGFSMVVKKLRQETLAGLKGWRLLKFRWIDCLDG